MALPKKILVPVVLLLAAVGLGSWYTVTHSRNHDDAIRVSGNIECTEVGVSFKIPGRVEKRYVDEGQQVSPGQPIAQLETADLKAERDLRLAELKAAEAASAELEAGSRPEEIAAAKAARDKAAAWLAELEAGSRQQEVYTAMAQKQAAQVEMNRLETELARSKQLFQRKMIPAESYDQAKAAYDVAAERYRQAVEQYDLVKEGPRQQQIDQAKAALAQAEWQYKLVQKGPREETKAQAKAKVEQAEAALRLAETKLKYATIYSPLERKGIVLSKNIEPGEYVAAGTPIVTVADLEKVWVRAYVEETRNRLKHGQKVEVTTDAYPDTKFEGRVGFISDEAEFTPKQVQTEKERTRLVYRIKIDIENSNGELKPGMPADAKIVRQVANLPQ